MFILGVTVEDRSPIRILKKELNKIKKKTMEEVADKFAKENIPPRFAAGNSRKWRHQKRDEKYLERKKKKVGHTTNLVLTGQSRRAAIHNSLARGTSQGAQLRLSGMPRHFFFRAPRKPRNGRRGQTGLTGPDKVAEIKQVNAGEIEVLRKFARKRMLQRIKRLKAIRRRQLT